MIPESQTETTIVMSDKNDYTYSSPFYKSLNKLYGTVIGLMLSALTLSLVIAPALISERTGDSKKIPSGTSETAFFIAGMTGFATIEAFRKALD